MVNYYGILGVNKNASGSEIKRAYRELLIWHPDKNPPDGGERFKEISMAYKVLSNPTSRIVYDLHGDSWEEYFVDNNEEEIFTCSKLGCGKKFKKRQGGIKYTEREREKYFCSREHLDDYLVWIKNQEGGITEPCQVCGSDHQNTGVPPKCEEASSAFSELELLSCWGLFTSDEKIEYKEEIRNAKTSYYEFVEFKREVEKILERAKNKNIEKENKISQERNEYIQKLENLDGWDLFSEDKKENIIEEMKRNRTTDQFTLTLQSVKKAIAKLQGKDDGDDNGKDKNLQVEIQKAIREIETELNKEPKITTDENWKIYIEGSSTLVILQSRKQKILDDIRDIREEERGGNQSLTKLRLRAISLIKRELEKNSFSASELTNPNWENDINQAPSESAIKEIQNWVLADIKNKRAAKQEKNRLQELLASAKQKENWDNYTNLENILKQIKELRTSNAYQENELEIQALESRLLELEPSRYQETVKDLLDRQVKDNGLNDSNMDEETKKAVAEAKQDPTNPKKRAKAEEKIAQNGADNKLKDFVSQIQNKLKKGNLSKEEKAKLAGEILAMIAPENKYQKSACQKYKPELNKLLAELQGGTSKQEDTRTPWFKIFGIAALIALPLIILAMIILRVRRRKLERENWTS